MQLVPAYLIILFGAPLYKIANVFFFFQAADGIRAGHVTGVQTCALPISGRGGHRGLLLPQVGEEHRLRDGSDRVDRSRHYAAGRYRHRDQRRRRRPQTVHRPDQGPTETERPHPGGGQSCGSSCGGLTMLTGRRTHRTTSPWAATMVAEPRFEVIPLRGIAAGVVDHLDPGATVTVTASPRHGLQPTLELATVLAGHGMNVVPHLAARLVPGRDELAGILTQLESAGVGEVFVIGGDNAQPVGEFASSLDLLTAMAGIGHDLTVGVAGYPEPHPGIDDDVLIQAM